MVEVEEIRNPWLVLNVGETGLFVNVVGLFMFHGHGHGHSHGGGGAMVTPMVLPVMAIAPQPYRVKLFYQIREMSRTATLPKWKGRATKACSAVLTRKMQKRFKNLLQVCKFHGA